MVKKEDGFTLIEVIVVIVIVTIALLIVTGTFIYNSQTSEKSEEIAQALSFQEGISEDVRSVGRDMVNNEGYDNVNYNDPDTVDAFSPDNIYTRIDSYYDSVDNMEASFDADDFKPLSEDLEIESDDGLLIKKANRDDMMAVVKISNYIKKDSDGNIIKDDDGNEIIIKEMKEVKIVIKWLDRSRENIKQEEIKTLITRR